jgi:hypothetical protein
MALIAPGANPRLSLGFRGPLPQVSTNGGMVTPVAAQGYSQPQNLALAPGFAKVHGYIFFRRA